MKRLTITISAFIAFSSCKQATNPDLLINQKASLPEKFKLSELHQKVITSFINKRDSTMSTLYGNEKAFAALSINAQPGISRASFTLVTWHQQDDPHWFGARIPGDLVSVETVKASSTSPDVAPEYQIFSGKELVSLADTTGRADRIRFILSQKASVLP
jgi:FtsP/CotA-like multicopper oxidase with cupredoxin domain